MEATVKTIVYFKPTVKRVNLDIGGIKAKTYVDDKNVNSKRWKGVKYGDCIKGLEWFDKNGKIVDADSGVIIKGN